MTAKQPCCGRPTRPHILQIFPKQRVREHSCVPLKKMSHPRDLIGRSEGYWGLIHRTRRVGPSGAQPEITTDISVLFESGLVRNRQNKPKRHS